MKRSRALGSRSWRTIIIVSIVQILIPALVSALLGKLTVVQTSDSGIHVSNRSTSSQIYQHLSGLINIVIVPLTSIVPALLYLKMRQLGGEDLTDVLAQIEEADDKLSQWQERMRTRLSLPGSRNSKGRSQPSDGAAGSKQQAARAEQKDVENNCRGRLIGSSIRTCE